MRVIYNEHKQNILYVEISFDLWGHKLFAKLDRKNYRQKILYLAVGESHQNSSHEFPIVYSEPKVCVSFFSILERKEIHCLVVLFI